MSNKDRLAKWWVSLNRWEWPDDLETPGTGPISRDHIAGAFAVVNRLAHREGLALWNKESEKERP